MATGESFSVAEQTDFQVHSFPTSTSTSPRVSDDVIEDKDGMKGRLSDLANRLG